MNETLNCQFLNAIEKLRGERCSSLFLTYDQRYLTPQNGMHYMFHADVNN